MKYNNKFYQNKYISEAIEEYLNQNVVSFHMPSHKNNTLFLGVNDLLNVDYTEIDGFDNLQNPKNTIKKSSERISNIYNTKHSYMLVNGSTVGIMASILGSVSEDELILINFDSHKSVLSAIELGKCHYGYIYKDKSKFNNYTDFDYTQLEETIINYEQTKKVKAICITSPSYEGVICNVKKLSKICKKYDILLIVDEAHGAHFNLNNELPFSSISLGADIVIQSLHKTMPSLTQTALLHICSNNVNKEQVEKYLYMLQTSSPSYIFMYTIDKLMENINNINFSLHNKCIKKFREEFKKESNGTIKILDQSDFHSCYYDFTRLVIYCKKISGIDLHKILLEKYKFNFEMANKNFVIGITSPFDDFTNYTKLKIALLEIEKIYFTYNEISLKPNIDFQNYNVKKFPKIGTSILINIEDALNCVASENIIPYPPGVPVVCTGDILTCNNIKIIKSYIKNSKEVLGVYYDEEKIKIKVFK